VVDDTALPKKGQNSIGVAPQYASALGKNANCQTLTGSLTAMNHPQSKQPPVAYDTHGTIRHVPLAPHHMTAAVTPTDRLFMLAHLGLLRLAPEDWRLDVTGLVDRPLRLRLPDLGHFSPARVEAVHQCAGNPLAPTVPTRRVACVVWEGVWLRDVLAEAGVRPGAAYVWSDGADSGSFEGDTVPFFRKDLPLARLGDDVLLATRVNGDVLPDRHGGPVRLVVPGFYGTNSVKWLWRLTLADRRADGLFTTRYYNDALSGGGRRPVWALAPECVIVSPAPGERVGGPIELRGWAWSDAAITQVEVSVDDGANWAAATVASRRDRAWQAWRFLWRPSVAGPAVLLCRAADAAGLTQPLEEARNAVHRVEVVTQSTV
jgi:sulfane dehydrogenase subunit SoxC